jgi:hypothetical protein
MPQSAVKCLDELAALGLDGGQQAAKRTPDIRRRKHEISTNPITKEPTGLLMEGRVTLSDPMLIRVESSGSTFAEPFFAQLTAQKLARAPELPKTDFSGIRRIISELPVTRGVIPNRILRGGAVG